MQICNNKLIKINYNKFIHIFIVHFYKDDHMYLNDLMRLLLSFRSWLLVFIFLLAISFKSFSFCYCFSLYKNKKGTVSQLQKLLRRSFAVNSGISPGLSSLSLAEAVGSSHRPNWRRCLLRACLWVLACLCVCACVPSCMCVSSNFGENSLIIQAIYYPINL